MNSGGFRDCAVISGVFVFALVVCGGGGGGDAFRGCGCFAVLVMVVFFRLLLVTCGGELLFGFESFGDDDDLCF